MNHNNISTPAEQIEFILFGIEEQLVEIELLIDLDALEYKGIELPQLTKSAITNLPLYLALVLVQEKKAKFINNDVYSTLYNQLRKQQGSVSLQELPEGFLGYYVGLLTAQHLQDDAITDWLDPAVAQKSRDTLQNLMNERLKKILRELKVVNYRKIDNKLDKLEKPLVNAIKNLILDYDMIKKRRFELVTSNEESSPVPKKNT